MSGRKFVPLTPEHCRALADRSPMSMQGYALVEADGSPLLIFGLALTQGQQLLFLHAARAVREEKRSIAMNRLVVAGMAKVRKMIQGVRAPVRALADPDFTGSCELLEHIGFEHLHGRVYQWPQRSLT